MKITILTLFPGMFNGFLENSIIKRAIGKEIVKFEIVNIRDFTKDKYGRVDTPPIGGGAGLIMKAQPIVDALRSVSSPTSHKILFSPRGATFNQEKARQFSKIDHLVMVCGHYEGIDERVNKYVNELVSIGDYILTGGEIPAMVVSDSLIRLLHGAIEAESLSEESFDNSLLEYPQYTEPYNFEDKLVPQILYSGNHQAISKWRLKEAIKLTWIYRPDLWSHHTTSKQEKALIKEIEEKEVGQWELDAIEKGKKFMKGDE